MKFNEYWPMFLTLLSAIGYKHMHVPRCIMIYTDTSHYILRAL